MNYTDLFPEPKHHFFASVKVIKDDKKGYIKVMKTANTFIVEWEDGTTTPETIHSVIKH